MEARLTVVGIGANGWESVVPAGRTAITAADVVLGGQRHLAMLPDGPGERVPWPSPLLDGLDELLARYRGCAVAVLASGDPMVSGIGSTLVRRLGADAVRVIPTVSSVALARARMRWSAEECGVVTLVGRDVDGLRRHLAPRRRLIVLSSGPSDVGTVARLLADEGFGASEMTVLAQLDGDDESRQNGTAHELVDAEGPPLSLLCIECRGGTGLSTAPGLPDGVFAHDGQISRGPVRAAAVSALAPRAGELLWDVGAGAGSVGVEWARAAPGCRTVAIERDAERAESIRRNAARLGVPDLVTVVEGVAPEVFSGIHLPDAVFVGGGGSRAGVLEACWAVLPAGGRLVAHAVTLETEAVLFDWYRRCGGRLLRLSVEEAGPIGTFTGWTPLRPVVQWSAVRSEPETGEHL